MDIFNTFATDSKKELEGVWRVIGGPKERVLVARANNRKYLRRLGAAIESHERALDAKNDAADDLSDSIMAAVVGETILLGFEGLTFKGAPLEYSAANSTMLCGVKDFRAKIVQMANEFDQYRAAQETEAKKA